jgi:hypothetical protein
MSEIFNKVEVLIDEILIEVIALKIVQKDFIPYKQAYSQALNQVAMRYAEIFPVRKTILETLLALKCLGFELEDEKILKRVYINSSGGGNIDLLDRVNDMGSEEKQGTIIK